LISNLYGNPHSASTPSALAGHRVDTIRDRALRFFNADPEHFDLVFVANATAAIKLVIDCFKDYAAVSNTPVWYGYHKDAHTSLVGVRESTKLHRCFATDEEVDIWINSGGLGGLQIDRAVANVTQVRSYPQIIPQGRHIHPFGRRRTCEHRTSRSV